MHNKTLIVTLAVICVTRLGMRAQELNFTFRDEFRMSLPGEQVTFSGSFTNTSGAELFINGYNFTLAGEGTYLIFDDTKFDLTVPSSLQTGGVSAGGSGELFDIHISSQTPLDTYLGSFAFLGGPDPADLHPLASHGFQVAVVPESTTTTFLVLGLGLYFFLRWKPNVELVLAPKRNLDSEDSYEHHESHTRSKNTALVKGYALNQD